MSAAVATTKKPETRAKAKIGTVESDKRDKTRKVVIEFSQKHPKYGKYIRKQSVLHVHDEKNQSRAGDTVEILPCAPVSRTKRWKIVRVVPGGAKA